MSAYLLDMPELYRRLDAQRYQRSLAWKDVASELGISPSTFTRMSQGSRPDADALVTLLVWLDLDNELAILIKPNGAP
ncbi:helix-turn-helix transcriptional regulator [Streptomyces cylindrosporus]|uniref:AraC family transcriptional regulator n=1 Tax=Streptomyces cylindrosporus TaxID=2927583 RepID=A0ABS9YPF7_9ACTN|nr:AraC family transcriptional regulator [Streptomyces cylindrosporus]MCI3279155.1 AraC family transcriptional regulator [Streptomyces cylindrosporus]